MSPTQAVHHVLLASSVTGVVETRIFPGRAPPRAVAPFVVVTAISEDVQSSFDASDASTLRASRIQVDCYHREHDQAHALAYLAEEALESHAAPEGLRAFKLDSRELYEDETQLHRVSMDFNVWHGR